ncbi:hypothetical protein FVE85_7069 [Porphyridium purpureum]|uniref:Uncharacterized protein n=1 Tax=Porphyridium purpureum TaxID=35688 RepID=A0A5J4Z922_PORPP|nr:hypothetical protein FVE85_7069 [Porphyridium purpureum]|eukprot:POR7936..scf295_1
MCVCACIWSEFDGVVWSGIWESGKVVDVCVDVGVESMGSDEENGSDGASRVGRGRSGAVSVAAKNSSSGAPHAPREPAAQKEFSEDGLTLERLVQAQLLKHGQEILFKHKSNTFTANVTRDGRIIYSHAHPENAQNVQFARDLYLGHKSAAPPSMGIPKYNPRTGTKYDTGDESDVESFASPDEFVDLMVKRYNLAYRIRTPRKLNLQGWSLCQTVSTGTTLAALRAQLAAEDDGGTPASTRKRKRAPNSDSPNELPTTYVSTPAKRGKLVEQGREPEESPRSGDEQPSRGRSATRSGRKRSDTQQTSSNSDEDAQNTTKPGSRATGRSPAATAAERSENDAKSAPANAGVSPTTSFNTEDMVKELDGEEEDEEFAGSTKDDKIGENEHVESGSGETGDKRGKKSSTNETAGDNAKDADGSGGSDADEGSVKKADAGSSASSLPVDESEESQPNNGKAGSGADDDGDDEAEESGDENRDDKAHDETTKDYAAEHETDNETWSLKDRELMLRAIREDRTIGVKRLSNSKALKDESKFLSRGENIVEEFMSDLQERMREAGMMSNCTVAEVTAYLASEVATMRSAHASKLVMSTERGSPSAETLNASAKGSHLQSKVEKETLEVEKHKRKLKKENDELRNRLDVEMNARRDLELEKSVLDVQLKEAKRGLDKEAIARQLVEDELESFKLKELEARRRLDRARMKIAAMKGEMISSTVDGINLESAVDLVGSPSTTAAATDTPESPAAANTPPVSGVTASGAGAKLGEQIAALSAERTQLINMIRTLELETAEWQRQAEIERRRFMYLLASKGRLEYEQYLAGSVRSGPSAGAHASNLPGAAGASSTKKSPGDGKARSGAGGKGSRVPPSSAKRAGSSGTGAAQKGATGPSTASGPGVGAVGGENSSTVKTGNGSRKAQGK